MLIHKLPPLLDCKSWTRHRNTEETEHRSAQGRETEKMSVKETLLIYFKHSSVSWVQHPTASPLQKPVGINHIHVPASLLIHKSNSAKPSLLWGKLDSSSPPSEHWERHSNSPYSTLALKSWLKLIGKCSLLLREKQVKELKCKVSFSATDTHR